MNASIRNVRKSDAEAIAGIYNYYIKNTIITFEEEEVDVSELENRIAEITKNHPWIVYEENGNVLGYAYASTWKARVSYRYSAESTVYLHPQALKRSIGSRLYEGLIKEIETKKNIHSLIAGISLPNEASVALHEKFNFKKIGHFNEVGFKFNKWIDVGYWERLFK